MRAGIGMGHAYWFDSPWLTSKIGIGIEKPLARSWSFMPSLEVAYNHYRFWRYSKLSGNGWNAEGEIGYAVNWFDIQVPILAAYRMNLSNKWNLLLKAGPYITYAFLVSKPSEDVFNYFDLEGTFGLDFGIDFERKHWVFGLEYHFGFLEFDYGADVGFGALYATVGFKF